MERDLNFKHLKEWVDRHADSNVARLWSERMNSAFEQEQYYHSLFLCVHYGATEEDIKVMTKEERLTYIHLFGS